VKDPGYPALGDRRGGPTGLQNYRRTTKKKRKKGSHEKGPQNKETHIKKKKKKTVENHGERNINETISMAKRGLNLIRKILDPRTFSVPGHHKTVRKKPH